MITLMVIFCLFLMIAFIVAVLAGIVAIFPGLLLLVCLPIIDYFIFKLIFGKKKK